MNRGRNDENPAYHNPDSLRVGIVGRLLETIEVGLGAHGAGAGVSSIQFWAAPALTKGGYCCGL